MSDDNTIRLSFANPRVAVPLEDKDKSLKTTSNTNDRRLEQKNPYKNNDKDNLINDKEGADKYFNINDYLEKFNIDSKLPNEIIDSHLKTISTIKSALQDIANNAYETTSKGASTAAGIIQEESAKQIEKIKTYRKRKAVSEGSGNSKKVQKEGNSNIVENTNDNDVLLNMGNKIEQAPPAEVSPTQVALDYLNKLMAQASDIVKDVTERAGLQGVVSFTMPCFNDKSSEYDKPDPKLHEKKPEQIGHEILNNTTASNPSVFMMVRSMVMSYFNFNSANDEASSLPLKDIDSSISNLTDVSLADTTINPSTIADADKIDQIDEIKQTN